MNRLKRLEGGLRRAALADVSIAHGDEPIETFVGLDSEGEQLLVSIAHGDEPIETVDLIVRQADRLPSLDRTR